MKWIEVMVRVPRSRRDLAGDLLLQTVPQGFVEATEDRGPGRLVAYLPATSAGRSVLLTLVPALEGAGAAVATRVRSDASWRRARAARGRRVRVGGLVIQPPRMPRPAGVRAVVRISPGLAFGSGDHESTRLCLRAVARHVRPGATVIDLGTGSGILAIAAAKLGATTVLAIDHDPVAVSVARANVRINRVGRRVTVRRGEGLAGRALRADLLVANLTADALPPILRHIPRHLARGGRLVVSGFTRDRRAEVRRRLSSSGLRVVEVDREGAWCAAHAVVR